MEHKSKNFAWPTSSVNSLDYDSFTKWISKNRKLVQEKKIIVFGAGIRGTLFYILLEKFGVNNLGFTDNNEIKWGGNIDGIPIIPPIDAIRQTIDGTAVILVSTENNHNIVDQLSREGLKEEKDFFCIRTYEYDEYVLEFIRHYDNKFLFMGDCEYSNISFHDSDPRNLARMIRDEFGEEHTKVLAMHGMHLRSQYHIFKKLLDTGNIPETLFLMINFDTLTGKQHLLPRSQHARLLEMIEESTDRDEEFADYVALAKEREKEIKAEFLINTSNLFDENRRKRQNANYFRLNYMYKLNPEVEGIEYLKKTLLLCREKEVRCVPFIPPVNYEYAREILGEKFEIAYKANQEMVIKIFDERKVSYIDFSFMFGKNMFSEPDAADETTNDKGRARMVNRFKEEVETNGNGNTKYSSGNQPV